MVAWVWAMTTEEYKLALIAAVISVWVINSR